MNFLSFITNKKIFFILSLFVKYFLIFFYKVKVGKNFYCENFPRLKIKGNSNNIIIGDNVLFLGIVDLRNRENGKIIIENNVMIENNCRFVASKDSTIKIGNGTKVCADAIWNGGADINVGKKCIFAMRSSINSNEHKTEKNIYVQDQGFRYGEVIIEDDCLMGVNVSINKGVKISKGSIIGANSVITKDTEKYSINAGAPSMFLSYRN